MNQQAQFWKDRLDELEREVTSVQVVNDDKLIDWTGRCVSTFSLLGVSSDIIRGFINLFEQSSAHIAPEKRVMYGYWQNPSRRHDRIKGFFYPNVGAHL